MGVKGLDIDDVPVINKLPITIGIIMVIISVVLLYFYNTSFDTTDECCGGLIITLGLMGVLFIITGFRKRIKQFKKIKNKRP